MKLLFSILGWMFGVLFFLLFLLGLFSKHYFPSILILIIVVLLVPPLREWIGKATGIKLPVWLRGLSIPVLLVLFVFLIFKGMGNEHSIYKNPDIENRLMAIYENRMAQWPVPYEARYIDTQYGKVFAVVCGEEDAPPVLLLHASSMASWSWLYNIRGLAERYRLYAIDTIGDAGRSVLDDIETFPNDGRSLSEFYAEIMDTLGVRKTCVIGASQGGFIATNMALHAPERVEKLLLCGPMGYTGTHGSVAWILLTTMFPVKPI